MPFSTEVRFNVVDLLDVAEAVAQIVLNPGHDFATYELAGPEALSQRDMAAVISDVIGKRSDCPRFAPRNAERARRSRGAIR